MAVIDAVLMAVASSPSCRSVFVLRGGVLMQHWFPSDRVAFDVDFLALCGLDRADLLVRQLLSSEIISSETTWEETPWPGLRYQLRGGFQLDVGANDPLAVPPQEDTVCGASLLCVAPEVMWGWKAHGLFERGEGRWKARDLYDLYLLQTRLELNEASLLESVRVAFISRDTAFSASDRFFDPTWGTSMGSKRKWTKFRKETPNADTVPVDLMTVKTAVADRLAWVLEKC